MLFWALLVILCSFNVNAFGISKLGNKAGVMKHNNEYIIVNDEPHGLLERSVSLLNTIRHSIHKPFQALFYSRTDGTNDVVYS